MGGAGFISSEQDDQSEEEKEVPRGNAGVRVFRPNLSGSQGGRFAEDSRSSAQSTEA